MAQNPTWVTGATGFLGSHVMAAALGPVVGMSRRGSTALDLTESRAVEDLWRAAPPRGILHLAAISRPGLCEANPGWTQALNVFASEHLARLAGREGVPMVFASTDLVFDGRQAPYRPESTPRPLSAYGRQKAEAERRIRRACPHAVIARLPLMYDRCLGDHGCFATALVAAWSEGRETPLFTDEFRTPALARDVAEFLWRALETIRGVTVHLGGPQRLDRFTFGKHLARAVGASPRLLKPVCQADLTLVPRRPGDVSLVSGRWTCPTPTGQGVRFLT